MTFSIAFSGATFVRLAFFRLPKSRNRRNQVADYNSEMDRPPHVHFPQPDGE